MLTQSRSSRTFRGQNRFVRKVNILTCLASLGICGFIWILTYLPLNHPKWAISSLLMGASFTVMGPLGVLFSKQVIKTCYLTSNSEIDYTYLYSIQSLQRYCAVLITHMGLTLLITPLIYSYSFNPFELVIGIISLSCLIAMILQLNWYDRYQFPWTHIIIFGLMLSFIAIFCGCSSHSLVNFYLYMLIISYHTKTAVECYQLDDPDHVYCLISIPTGSLIKLIDIMFAVGGTIVDQFPQFSKH